MQNRQGDLAILDVVADRLPDYALLANDIEAVVDDLEREADLLAVASLEEVEAVTNE